MKQYYSYSSTTAANWDGNSGSSTVWYPMDYKPQEWSQVHPYPPVPTDGYVDALRYITSISESPKESLPKGVEMKNLYEVIAVYAEDRNNPVIVNAGRYVMATDDAEAKQKSGIYKVIDDKWDNDFLTIIVRNLGAVKVKERPKEVVTVKEK